MPYYMIEASNSKTIINLPALRQYENLGDRHLCRKVYYVEKSI